MSNNFFPGYIQSGWGNIYLDNGLIGLLNVLKVFANLPKLADHGGHSSAAALIKKPKRHCNFPA